MDRVSAPMTARLPACLPACLSLRETMSFCLSVSLSWSEEKPALGTGFFGVMLQAKCFFILYEYTALHYRPSALLLGHNINVGSTQLYELA